MESFIKIKKNESINPDQQNDSLLSITKSLMIIWCFNNINDEEKNITRTLNSFTSPLNHLKLSSTQVLLSELGKLKSVNTNTKRVILIISGSLAKELEDELKTNSLIDSVFIYCYVPDKYKSLMDQNKKIKSIECNYDPINQNLISNIAIMNENNMRMNFNLLEGMKLGYYFDTNKSCISYIYLDTIYSLMNKSDFDLEQSKNDFLNYSLNHLKNQSNEHFNQIKQDINEGKFETNIINWYTKETFFYPLLNNTFKNDDWTNLFELRYPIYLLNQRLKEEQKKQKSIPENLYKGTKLSKDQLEVFKSNIGKHLLLRGFNSTSDIIDELKKKFSKPGSLLLFFKIINIK